MLFRRTAISAIAIVPSVVLQSVLAMTLFQALLLAHQHCKPYWSEELNTLDLLILLALLVTQFGCVIVATIPSWNMDLGLQRAAAAQDAIGMVLMVLNMGVCGMLLWRLLRKAEGPARDCLDRTSAKLLRAAALIHSSAARCGSRCTSTMQQCLSSRHEGRDAVGRSSIDSRGGTNEETWYEEFRDH